MQKHSEIKVRRLTSIELAVRYGVSQKLLEQWRRYEGFPKEASVREGASLLWDHRPVDQWLAARPPSKTGPKPRWRDFVDQAVENQ